MRQGTEESDGNLRFKEIIAGFRLILFWLLLAFPIHALAELTPTAPDSIVIGWIEAGDSLSLNNWLARGGDPSSKGELNYPLLSSAIQSHRLNLARLLILYGADPNIAGWVGFTALHYAVGNNDTSSIAFLLNNGADIERRDKADRTPLLLSIDWGRYEAFDYLVWNGADIHSEYHIPFSRTVSSPIHYAASKGFTIFIKDLLDAGVNIDCVDSEGNTPLRLAWENEYAPGVRCGNTYISEKMEVWPGKDAFLFLIHSGADTARWRPEPAELLWRGAKYDCPELIRFAAQRGAQIRQLIPMELGSGYMNHLDEDSLRLGRQAIHLAAKFNAVSALNYLTASGVPFDAPDADGWRPFDLAVHWDSPDAVRFFIEKGVNPNRPLSNGVLPLQQALRARAYKAHRALREKGADPTKLDLSDPAPLLNAVYDLDTALVKDLIRWGFNVNKPGAEQKRPIHQAADRGSALFCSLLLDAGASPDLTDAAGSPAFGYIFWDYIPNYRSEAAKLLIRRGANLNKRLQNGHTALAMAVIYKDFELVDLTLEHGADPNIPDDDGWGPLSYVGGEKSVDLAEKLISHGANINPFAKINERVVHHAVEKKDKKLLEYLLAKGFDRNLNPAQQKDSPLFIAVTRGDAELAKMLLEAGANPNIGLDAEEALTKDENMFNAAAYRGDTTMMRILIEAEMQVSLMLIQYYRNDWSNLVSLIIEERRQRGESDLIPEKFAIYLAGFENSIEVAKVLIDAGADLNYRDRQRQTPLWWVVNAPEMAPRKPFPKPEMADLMLSRGAKPNQTDIAGNNLLCFSCSIGADWMVSRLLKAGADPNSTQRGERAIVIANGGGYGKIVKILTDAGANPIKFQER